MNSRDTVLERLAWHLRDASAGRDGWKRPVAVLWTDLQREWLPIIGALRGLLPELFVLGEYQSDKRQGPAIWLRCVVERGGDVPILYLPGVSRRQLRSGEGCADELKPLVELLFRGEHWHQVNGNDWTVRAFLTSVRTLGLSVADDADTSNAMRAAIAEVADMSVGGLQKQRLESRDFEQMQTGDMVRALLRWMRDPDASMDAAQRRAFRESCKREFDFDPEACSPDMVGEQLGKRQGRWMEVWERIDEAPGNYKYIAELLRGCQPQGEIVFDRLCWPSLNDKDEEEVRLALNEISSLPYAEARKRVMTLEKKHGGRRCWVWARMGLSPMASVLKPLARMASAAETAVGGTTPDEVAEAYMGKVAVDAEALDALAVMEDADQACVSGVVRCLLQPWLDASARAFQTVLERQPLPKRTLVEVGEDECILFVDGLRFDLGQRLTSCLEDCDLQVTVGWRWAALPTVTATAKPAITPVADQVTGETLGENFCPSLQGKNADARNLREVMAKKGYQILERDNIESPGNHPARGWLETQDIDKLGHKLDAVRFAKALDTEVARIADSIQGLLDAGWKAVRVVTDHGWLLLPGGLPKVDLPKHLTASRWARCAVMAGAEETDSLMYPWHWNEGCRFATAPGIACFNKSEEYAHGGVSVQECMTPDLRVELGVSKVIASIRSITWKRLRCFVEAEGEGLTADLWFGRSSVVASPKPLSSDGTVSLVLLDTDHEKDDLILVLLDKNDRIVAHWKTRVGDNS